MAEKLINADILDVEAVHNAELSELEAVLEIDKELA